MYSNNILNRKDVYSEVIIILMAVFSIQALIVNPSIFIMPIIIAGFFLLILFSFKANKETLAYMLSIIVFQNIICVILSPYINSRILTFLIAYKEMIVYLTIIIFVVFRSGIKYILINRYLIFYIISLILGFVISRSSIFVRFISLRQMLIPVVTFIFGMAISINERQLKNILKTVVYIVFIICILGVIEVTILNDEFWKQIGIVQYMELKGFDQWIYNGLPGNYYTADFIGITGKMYRRMVSIFTDPLLLSHFIVVGLIILIYLKDIIKNKILRNIIILIMLICLIWTMSKGALLILATAILFKYYKINRRIFTVMLIISCLALIFIIKTDIFHTVSQHTNGLIDNLKNASVFGDGLGAAGNFAIIYSEVGSDIGAGESYIGTLLGQMGVIGVVSYVLFNINIIKVLMREKYNDFNNIVVILILGMFIESILSESAVSFIGSGIYFIFAGIAYRLSLKNNCKKII